MSLEAAFAATQSWFFDHGWQILLTIFVAYIIRQFGVAAFRRIINRSVASSERFESKRDKKLRVDTLTSLVSSIINVVTGIGITVMVLSELGVFAYFAPLFGSAVAVSLVLGFGIQAFVKDFISGIFIVAENQYRVGDVVHIHPSVGGGEFEGVVVRISLRTTVIRDNDGAIHFIPNGNIARAANQTLDYARVNVEIELPLSADFDKAEKEFNKLGLMMHKEEQWQKCLIQAPYFHGVQKYEGDHVVVEVRAKTIPAEQWRVSSELNKRLASLISSHNKFEAQKPTSKKS